jgi:hypothetical protein
MSRPPDSSIALKYRRDAAACERFAANARTVADRALLLRMQRSLLGRADHQDWLDGLPPVPPARPNVLALPRRPDRVECHHPR